MKRKGWIDALRALAIMLVIMGHQMNGVNEFFVFTSPVKIPLFFAISGYLFKTRDGDSRKFYQNLFIKIIIPWFCLALISYIPILIKGESFFVFLGNLVSGKMLWFMPCFVIAEIIFFYVIKLAKLDYLIAIVCVLLTVLGLYLHGLGILDFAMCNRALSVQLFFLIGYLIHKNENMLINLSWKLIGLFGGAYVFLTVLSLYLFPNESIDVHQCRYYNYAYCYILIIMGLLFLFTASAKSNFSNRVLSIIGQNTLVLYIWHGSVIGLFNGLMSLLKINIEFIWVSAIIKTFWAVIVGCIIAHYVSKFVPEIVGKRRLPLDGKAGIKN